MDPLLGSSNLGGGGDGSFTPGGDLGGNSTFQIVIGLQGNPVKPVTLGAGQDGWVLTWVNGDGLLEFKPGGSGTLAGDAVGPLGSNTVIKINGASVPSGPLTTGNVLQVIGPSSLEYAPVNLAGGTNYVVGELPAGNLPVATTSSLGIIELNNDLGGTATDVVVLSSYSVPVLAYSFMMMGA